MLPAHILYVEDDELSREVMELSLLDTSNYTISILPNSENFAANLATMPPNLQIVLLDIHVKPLDGFEMLQIVRHHPAHQHCRIIALTASVMNEEVLKLRQAGFDGALAKPIDSEHLLEQLDAIRQGRTIWSIIGNY